MFLFPIPANLTDDVAAPDEVALALLLHFPHARLVAPATAEQSAAVNPLTGAIAHPAVGPQNVQSETNNVRQFISRPKIFSLRFILLAIIRRFVKIDQVGLVGFLQVGTYSAELFPAPFHEFHVGSAFVALEESFTYLSEGR